MSLFNKNFIGKLCKVTNSQMVTEAQEDGSDATGHLFTIGILVDVDKYFYYLGENAKEIKMAIDRSQVVSIELMTYQESEEQAAEFVFGKGSNYNN